MYLDEYFATQACIPNPITFCINLNSRMIYAKTGPVGALGEPASVAEFRISAGERLRGGTHRCEAGEMHSGNKDLT